MESQYLSADRASNKTKPQVNDLVIRGYLLAIQEGDERKRIGVGFGGDTPREAAKDAATTEPARGSNRSSERPV